MIAGVDEAGRGSLAGPVVAAAVVLPEHYNIPKLTDSKKLTAKQRTIAETAIKLQTYVGIGWASPSEIDDINILRASFLAMHRALDALKCHFTHILVDGNRFVPYPNKTHDCIIKGDAKEPCISAASIIAKTHRDRLMDMLDAEHPPYNWKTNKGYPTIEHRKAIKEWGPCAHHRKSFSLLANKQLSLDF